MAEQVIGVVGVGLMGHGIAKNIQSSGWSIGFLEHAGNQPTTDLIEKGATVYSSCAQLAKCSDVIILCVTGSPQVESVLTGPDGVLGSVKKGAVIIDCSTAIPSSTIAMSKKVEEAGAVFLDAPMTRTSKEAEEGRLNLIVGGDRAIYEAQLPLLQSFAENITYAGTSGAGHTLKLLHNYVSLGYATVLSEATAASNRAGIDPDVLHQVLATGGGGGVVLDRLSPFMLNKDPSGLAFSLSNSAKDIAYYTKMCEDIQASDQVANAVGGVLSDQVSKGHGEEHVPVLIELLTEASE